MPRKRTPAAQPLASYWAKRDFTRTPEPKGDVQRGDGVLRYVLQKHSASRLHYDLRLEIDGVLVSWALPKGPSIDPADRRLAVRTEDHPLAYLDFEGTIPKGQYGGGSMIVWDLGEWRCLDDPAQGLVQGKLRCLLNGVKLHGLFELIRPKPASDGPEQWLMFKQRDAHARTHAQWDPVASLPDSVLQPALVRRRVALPAALSPQLATQAAAPPRDGAWLCELKYDGYRLLCRVAERDVRCFTRNGIDWSDRLPELRTRLSQAGCAGSWLDGELVCLGTDGLPDFHGLQSALRDGRHAALVYYVFDAPYLTGQDLRARPLDERRARLAQWCLQHARDPVRLSALLTAETQQLLNSAQQMGLEGLMLKRASAPYRDGRSDDWLKLKGRLRQEFVVIGYRRSAARARSVGSLALAVNDGRGRWVGVGHVGTGWDEATAAQLWTRLHPLHRDTPVTESPEPELPSRSARRQPVQ